MTSAYTIVGLSIALAMVVIIFGLYYAAVHTGQFRTPAQYDSRAEDTDTEKDELRKQVATLSELREIERKNYEKELTLITQEYEQRRLELRKQHELERTKLRAEFAEQKRSEAKLTAQRSRTALVAKIAEHFAPLLQGFKYNPKDARHIGELVDFIIYDGLEDGEIRDVIFLEIKTRASGARVTNKREKLLKDAIDRGRVRYEVFVPDTGEAKVNYD